MDSHSTTTLLRPADVAERLKVSRATAYRLIRAGELKTVHVGAARAARITEADLAEYIEASRTSKAS